MSLLKIQQADSCIEINPQGCRIEKLQLGNKQIFWSGQRPDGKLAATHPCIPNFGQITTGKYRDIPQHGPARNANWTLAHYSANSAIYHWRMPEIPLSTVNKIYPSGLVLDRVFIIRDDSFTLTTKIHNTSKLKLPVNPGEHCYFLCLSQEIKNVTINSQKIDSAKLPDTIYLTVNKALNLNIPGIGCLAIKLTNYRQIAIWSLKDAEYICIEPIAGRPNDIYNDNNLLKPNEVREYGIKIRI